MNFPQPQNDNHSSIWSSYEVAFFTKKTIRNFSRRMFQPIATITIDFAIIKVHGEINSKFELPVADRNSPKDIQIVSF